MSERPSVRVLVVDDNPSDALLARALLSESLNWRFEIIESRDFVDAERVIMQDRERFDAVLFGLRDTGAGAIRRLRHLTSALGPLPLILCHEFLDDAESHDLAAAGVQAILPKTMWSTETLSHTIAFAIGQARRMRAFGHDLLTGLPTRSVWLDRLNHALDRCRRTKVPFALMIVDLDDFKHVNDTLGHEVGDLLLKEVAVRLRHAVRQNDTVARLGGDEFAVLVEDLVYPEAALRVARKIIKDVCAPVVASRATLPVSASVGVAILSAQQRQLSVEWAHKAADTALYAAKGEGKKRFSVFTDDMDRALLASLKLDDDLVRAVQRNEFSLHYQPVVDVRSGAVAGFEALLRWERGPRSGISPGIFVPILERLGLMGRVGLSIMEEALAQLGRWRRQSGQDLFMHVNLSASQVIDADFSSAVLLAIDRAQVPADSLVIELTETVLFKHGDALTREFDRLRRKGVRIAIDDFGTGYNSLVYLKQFQPDVVKIDRGFIREMPESRVDGAIVRGQAELAKALGITLVAEGVETESQLQALAELGGVDMMQGFLTGRPMGVQDLESAYTPFMDTEGLASSGRSKSERSALDGRLRTAEEVPAACWPAWTCSAKTAWCGRSRPTDTARRASGRRGGRRLHQRRHRDQPAAQPLAQAGALSAQPHRRACGHQQLQHHDDPGAAGLHARHAVLPGDRGQGQPAEGEGQQGQREAGAEGRRGDVAGPGPHAGDHGTAQEGGHREAGHRDAVGGARHDVVAGKGDAGAEGQQVGDAGRRGARGVEAPITRKAPDSAITTATARRRPTVSPRKSLPPSTAHTGAR